MHTSFRQRAAAFIHNNEGMFLLAIMVVVLKIPSLYEPYWDFSESMFLTVGKARLAGMTLPMVLTGWFGPIMASLGALTQQLGWWKLTGIIISLVSLVWFYLITGLFFKKEATRLGVTGIFGLALACPLTNGDLVTEQLIGMNVVLGAYLALRPRRPRTVRQLYWGVLLYLGIVSIAIIGQPVKTPALWLWVIPGLALLLGFTVEAATKFKWGYLGVSIGLGLVMVWSGVPLRNGAAYYPTFFGYVLHLIDEGQYVQQFGNSATTDLEISRWIETHTRESDRILVWGNSPQIYAESKRLPSDKHWLVDLNESNEARAMVLEHMNQTPPPLVVDRVGEAESFPAFYALLANHYIPVYAVNGATIYRPFKAGE